MNKRLLIVVLSMIILIMCSGCAKEKELPKQTEVGFYLDTVITLTAYAEDSQVLKDALTECGRYEQLLSRTVEGSDVWRINHAGGEPVEVSDDTAEILRGFSGGLWRTPGGIPSAVPSAVPVTRPVVVPAVP